MLETFDLALQFLNCVAAGESFVTGKGREQSPKTPGAVRDIDIAEPRAALLRTYVEGKTGLLFATRSGGPLSQRNVHRAAGHALHAFRRFRTEVLRRARVPEDLIGMWLGHTRKTVTDLYADGLKNDRSWASGLARPRIVGWAI